MRHAYRYPPLWVVASFFLASGAHAVTLTRITFDPAADSGPVFSPDGTRIAYIGEAAGNRDIWVIGADGSNPIQLTFEPANDESPAWSPDGQTILFDSDREGGAEQLYRMPSTGGPAERVTFSGRRDLESHRAWQGSWVVCHSAFGQGNWDIVVYDASTGGLVHVLTDSPAADFEPAFSPVLERIVFRSDRTGNRDLFIAPIPLGPPTRLTTFAGNDLQPHWSRSHGLIAFASDRGRAPARVPAVGPLSGEDLTLIDADIWITDETGSFRVPVTADGHQNHQPTWSADGRRIVFQSYRTGNWDVFIADDLPLETAVEPATWGAVKAKFQDR
jgi:Tol biopolymer transport system component